MGRLLVRVTVIATVVYFLICYYFAQFECVDIMTDWYIVPFELIIVVYSYAEGKYHCKHLRHCALGIFISDTITRADNAYDFMSVSMHNILPALILFVAMSYTLFSALKHFYKVRKIKNKK